MNDAVKTALENIYASVNGNNEELDARIDALKVAVDASGEKTVLVDKAKLVHGSRPARKLMQSYFKKRGVALEFTV